VTPNEVVSDIMTDIKTLENFRNIQRSTYMSKENPKDIKLVHEVFNPENKEQKLKSKKEAFLKHQEAYVCY
jgi:virulence-associated protein VapD